MAPELAVEINNYHNMRIEFLKRRSQWPRKVFCITHSDRPTEPERCSLNFLETRFNKPDRLPAKVAFESLPHVSTQQPFKGAVTVWDFGERKYDKPSLLAVLRPEEYKPQHALWYLNRLWILGVDRLEIYDSGISLLAAIDDPWLSGAHTIIPDGNGYLLITCSGSDSVLFLSDQSLTIDSALRVPEYLYGRNFNLLRDDSVVDHYIPNDLQLTHINCASSWRGGVVVSMLIQGAVGWFDAEKHYRELLRGFVGCHGVRSDSRTGCLYFSDSCLGTIVFLNEGLGIHRRIDMNSKWLHDALQIDGPIYVGSVTDSNRITLLNVDSRETVAEISGAEFGMGTQFLSY